MSGLALAVPSLTYTGLFSLYTHYYTGMPKYIAEFIAAAAALFLTLMVLKVYNDKENVGLELKRLFAIKPFKRTLAVFVAGFSADAILTAALLYMIYLYYPDAQGSQGILKIWGDNDKWFFVFVSTTLYASCEEIVLRGLVYSYIKKHAGVMKALLISSLLFTFLHGSRVWPGVLVVFLSGAIYALMFEKTRSLAAPCLAHGFHNFVLRVIVVTGALG